MNCASARCRLATAPVSTAKRAPEIRLGLRLDSGEKVTLHRTWPTGTTDLGASTLTTTGDGVVDDLTGLRGYGRYVRMYGTVRGLTASTATRGV